VKRTHWKDYAELIGIGAIVASLIFVGQQLRLDRQIAMGEAWLHFVEAQLSLSELIGHNSELWIKGLDGEELSQADQLRFDEIVRAVEAGFSSRFARSSMGVRAGPADWEALKFAHEMYVHVGLRESVLRRWSRWQGLRDGETPFRPAVKQYLEKFDAGELMAESGPSFHDILSSLNGRFWEKRTLRNHPVEYSMPAQSPVT
jgi:hypothetical protein